MERGKGTGGAKSRGKYLGNKLQRSPGDNEACLEMYRKRYHNRHTKEKIKGLGTPYP